MMEHRLRIPLRNFGAVAASVAAVAALAAFASESRGDSPPSASAAKSCKGAPLTMYAVTPLSGGTGGGTYPDFTNGAQAAGKALTRACTLGRPVNVKVCDDKFDPNQAAACARKAVADKAIAVVEFGGTADSQIPILSAAGIPIFSGGVSSQENSNKLSFPIYSAIPDFMGKVTFAASLGVKNIAIPAGDIPAIKFFVDLATKVAATHHVKVTSIPVPLTQSDMGPVAGQILSANADGVLPVLGATPTQALLKALHQQGASFTKLRFIAGLGVLNPKNAKSLGSGVNGAYAISSEVSPTLTRDPAVKRFLSEMTAARKPIGDKLTIFGVMGWAGVHMAGDALKGQRHMTTATLVKRLETKGVIDSTKYGVAPVDYTKPAFPEDPTLSKLRIFTRSTSFWRFDKKSVPHRITSGWVDVMKKQKVPKS